MSSRTLWLDKFDSIWPVGRIKDHVDLINGFPFDSQSFSQYSGVRLVRIRDLTDGSGITYVDTPVPPTAMIDSGDVVVGMDGDFNVVVWKGGPAALNQRLCVLRSRPSLDQRFLAYLLPMPLKAINDVTYFTTVKHLSSDDLLAERIPIPPLPMQHAIVAYLDRETGRIDALITAKQQLVKSVEERVRLLAHELTTRSGELVPLRRLVISVKTGTTPPADELGRLSDGSVPWYSPGDVGEWLELSEPIRTLKREAVAAGWVPQFRAQSTLLVGIGATAGKVAFLSHAASGNQQMTCLVPGFRVLPRFLSWQLFARRDEIRATAPFTTLPIINNEFIKSLSVVVPLLAAQSDITGRLDDEAGRAKALAQRTAEQVALLRERRQALITAAVTGQLGILEAA